MDIIARGMSQWLGEKLNTPVVVENRPGANGMIGTRAVSGAEPDGYTLLFGYDGTLAIAPAIMEGSSFDPLAELAPVIRVVNATLVAASPTTLPVRSFEELIAYAKNHKVTYGTSGIGSTPHMFAEQMKLRAGLDWTHVPYKGGSAATADAVGGQISAVITAVASVLPFVKSGQLTALFVGGEERTPSMPEVPTLRELGYGALDVDSWYGLFAPAGTPQHIIEKLNREIEAEIQTPKMREQYHQLGFASAGGSPAQFAEEIRSDIARWKAVGSEAGIKIQAF